MDQTTERVSLYIPSNVQTRSEFFPGFGKIELIQTLLASGVTVGLVFLLNIFMHSTTFLVVAILTGIAGSITCLTKDRNNQSVADQLRHMIRFLREQKRYDYRYMKEWGDVY